MAAAATTIPEVTAKEDMDTASAEELKEQGNEPYGPKEAFGPHMGGIPYEDAVEMGAWTQLLNYWSLGGGYTHRNRASDDRDTRGGPLISSPASNQYWVSVENDWRQTTSGSVNFSWGSNRAGGSNRRLRGRFTLKPVTYLEVSVRPSYSWNRSSAANDFQSSEAGGTPREFRNSGNTYLPNISILRMFVWWL